MIKKVVQRARYQEVHYFPGAKCQIMYVKNVKTGIIRPQPLGWSDVFENWPDYAYLSTPINYELCPVHLFPHL